MQSSIGKLPIVAFVGQFLSTLLPVLEHFNIQAAIASGRDCDAHRRRLGTYLGWATLYCLLYTTIMLLVSLLMFEDRDLASRRSSTYVDFASSQVRIYLAIDAQVGLRKGAPHLRIFDPP